MAKALGTTERVVEDAYGRHAPEHLRGVAENVSGRRRWPEGMKKRRVMRDTEVSIRFFLAGKEWGARFWRQVPRRGEEVMLGGKHEVRGAYRVTRVVWGVEGPDEELLGIQAVNIEVEPVV